MMKKLLFCLFTLVGMGALSSCQQDDVVTEVVENKGLTIRASLPGNDAQSRVVLGDTSGGTTKVYWEEGDVITLKIDENTSYTFNINDEYDNENPSTSAEFTCTNETFTSLPAGTYTFTYGTNPTLGGEQNTYHYMTAEFTATAETAWSDVNLRFTTQVAMVEISLVSISDGETVTKVSLYDAANGAKIATTSTIPANKKVYFAVAAGTEIGNGLVLAETAEKTYIAEVGTNALVSGNLYRISQVLTGNITRISDDLKYAKIDDTLIVYGEGEIPSNAFSGRQDITRAIILEGITSIGNSAFNECRNLTSVSIPNSVTSIGDHAFYQCSGLTSVSIPNSVTSIGNYAFYQCSDLTSVSIPNSVTSIGTSAFNFCGSLTSVIIPENVTSIGSNAFNNCANLTSLTCLATVPPALSSKAFYKYSSEKVNIIYVPSESVEAYKDANNWNSYNIQAIP